MAVNKVIYDGNTLIDLTNMTATAEDVASGKTFYGKDGVLTTGTSSGGGGGLTYETGTFTPTADIARPTISFSRTHTEAPIYVAMFDVSNTTDQTTNTNYGWEYIDHYKLFGNSIPYSSTSLRYALITWQYRGTSTTSTTSSYTQCSSNSDSSSSSGTNYPKYWVDNSSFRPYTNSTSRMWRPTRTYKWIAIWK